VFCDRFRVEQALRQLVDNAVRASPDGGEVSVGVELKETDAVVWVKDQGIGIPSERQARIFEPFYRAHAGTSSDRGGLGLGLFLSREIAQKHGGDLWFESSEGRGSTFFLRIPRRWEAQ